MTSPQSVSFNSSVASSLYENHDNTEATKVKNYVKEMLKARIFLGRYTERRLINQVIGYRDIVIISTAETELKRDLIEAQCKLSAIIPNIHIGISETNVIGCSPAGGICLCTEIDNQPLGPFWFQIKTLKFRENEIIVSLKCIRHITDAFLELEPILTGAVKTTGPTDNENSISLNETYSEVKEVFKSALSIRNIKEFFTFIFALIIALFTGSTSFVNFLGNFILALVREMSILIRNSTPMFLGTLDFFSKIVGGFYLLLAMLFKQNAPPPTNTRSLTYYDRTRRHDNYDDKSFD